jgi:hypothetical protein
MLVLFKHVIRKLIPLIDTAFVLPIYLSGLFLKTFRRIGAARMPFSKACLLRVGVFPIRDHYYEPLFHPRHLHLPLENERHLPGIDMNESGQLELLNQLVYSFEIARRWESSFHPPLFNIDNGSFEAGDAEYWYNIIRHFKPARIIEIGSGFSTIIANQAIKRNLQQNHEYQCKHVCIEPYENLWLESIGVDVMRCRVEQIDISLFTSLESNDILFIDSSHVIRPQGDVLTEILNILPILAPGVVVHLHDIFTPRDYSSRTVIDHVNFWNEQYLLEAFLTHNRDWVVIGAINYLHHHHHSLLKIVCPYLKPTKEPGSFYIRRV